MKIVRKIASRVSHVRGVMRDVQRTHVEVGFQSTSLYPDGTPIAYVAAIQEYGTLDRSGHVPPRPFFRPTIAEKREEWADDIGRGVTAAIFNKLPYEHALEQIGLKAAGQVGRTISRVDSPPLAESTVKIKGHEKPLVDTGLMLQSVTAKVVKK